VLGAWFGGSGTDFLSIETFCSLMVDALVFSFIGWSEYWWDT